MRQYLRIISNDTSASITKVSNNGLLWLIKALPQDDTDDEGNVQHTMLQWLYKGVEPDKEKVKECISEYFNNEVQNKIQNEWTYKGLNIPLSQNDQSNYVMALISGATSLAVQTNDADITYIELSSTEEISNFVSAMQSYIQECIAWGRQQKESIKYSDFGFEDDPEVVTKNVADIDTK